MRKLTLPLALAAAIGLAGCESAGGAVIGALTGSAATGAAIGAVTGAASGVIYDRYKKRQGE